MTSSTSACKAKIPTACPYHGDVALLQKAMEENNVSAYMTARSKIEASKKDAWVKERVSFFNSEPEDPHPGLSVKEHKMLWKRLRGEYELKELKAMHINASTPAYVRYNRNAEASFDYQEEHTEKTFTYGACGFFAYALHEKTHYPLVVFTADKNANYWEGHVAVQVGENKYLDITGISTEDEYKRKYGFTGKGYSVEVTEDVERFKHLMGIKPENNIYDDLDDLESAILNRCSDDVIHDYVLN